MVWFKWWNFKDLCFWFPEDREMIQFDLMVFSLNIGLEPPTSFQAWNDPPCFSKRSSAWPKQSLLSSSLTSKAYGFGTTASKASPNMVPQYAVGHRLHIYIYLYTNTHSRYIYIWHMYYRFVVVKNHASFASISISRLMFFIMEFCEPFQLGKSMGRRYGCCKELLRCNRRESRFESAPLTSRFWKNQTRSKVCPKNVCFSKWKWVWVANANLWKAFLVFLKKINLKLTLNLQVFKKTLKNKKHKSMKFVLWNNLENQLLLISINFTSKTSHSCLKKWCTRFSRKLFLRIFYRIFLIPPDFWRPKVLVLPCHSLNLRCRDLWQGRKCSTGLQSVSLFQLTWGAKFWLMNSWHLGRTYFPKFEPR